MACYPMSHDGTTVTGHLCTGGNGAVIEVSRESAGIKWCFVCRKHLPHDFVCKDYSEPNYYGPWGRYDCSGCHQDHTLGFGMVREWG
jgi:hypothetical protein